MSMWYIMLAPVDPWHVPSREQQENATAYLRALNPESLHDQGEMEIEIVVHDGPQVYIGPESYDKAQCPNCLHVFDREWAIDVIDDLWNVEQSSFTDLTCVMPCCGVSTSFNLLHFPLSGEENAPLDKRTPARTITFARFWISILDARMLTEDELRELEDKLGTPIYQAFASH
jgi:hypothetical protein